MKKCIIFSILMIQALLTLGQDLNINHYPFYRDGLNPGSFIQAPEVNVFLLYNNEFWGFAEEPQTQIVDVSVNLNDNKLGLMVYNDIIGHDIAQNIKLRYARLFSLSDNSSFSLGLSTGAVHKRLQATKMEFEDPSDPVHMNDYAHTVLDFDFGAELQLDKLIVGLSTNHLGKPISEFDEVNPVMHYYGYAQYTIPTRTFRFKPNVLMRYWKKTFWIEAGVLAFYKDQFWLGSSYTDYHDLNFMAGMKVLKNIHFGYAFKSNMNDQILSPWNTNSHEIFLNFGFGDGSGSGKYPNSVRNMFSN
ncbi:MAG TPA: PorP/SprF family type IX secretion system membrane protein [Prolixibacteraceae bacterium]|nr:PorP/SprF family type IX secretion system membrane protein [Prolixibacteraceae bacterium]